VCFRGCASELLDVGREFASGDVISRLRIERRGMDCLPNTSAAWRQPMDGTNARARDHRRLIPTDHGCQELRNSDYDSCVDRLSCIRHQSRYVGSSNSGSVFAKYRLLDPGLRGMRDRLLLCGVVDAECIFNEHLTATHSLPRKAKPI
jgi:hypothetical protein